MSLRLLRPEGASGLMHRMTIPDFALRNTSGGTLRLSEYRKNSPVLLAFFRRDCPTCRLALPFLERLYRRHGRSGVHFLGIAQEGRQEAAAFAKELGIMMPLVLEEAPGWEASTACGVTELPAVLLLDAEGSIRTSLSGFSKRDYQQLADSLAQISGKPPEPLFAALASTPESAAGSRSRGTHSP